MAQAFNHALGNGDHEGIIGTDGSEVPFGGKGGSKLMFESPPANGGESQLGGGNERADDYTNMRFQRYQQPAAQVNNFITIRVFLRVSEET